MGGEKPLLRLVCWGGLQCRMQLMRLGHLYHAGGLQGSVCFRPLPRRIRLPVSADSFGLQDRVRFQSLSRRVRRAAYLHTRRQPSA